MEETDGLIGYLRFDLETSWRAHFEMLSLNLYLIGAPDGSPVLNGGEWGKVSYGSLNNGKPNPFTFKSLAGHYFGRPSVQCINPFVLNIIRDYANHYFDNAKLGDFFEYEVKKYRNTVMKGVLFAPDWTNDPKFISLENPDDMSVPF